MCSLTLVASTTVSVLDVIKQEEQRMTCMIGSMVAQDVCDCVRVSFGLLTLPFRQLRCGGWIATVMSAVQHIVIGRAVRLAVQPPTDAFPFFAAVEDFWRVRRCHVSLLSM